MSHAVRGAELERFLEVGACRVPVLASAPLKRTVIVDLDFMEDEDDPGKIVFGHESDGRFCLHEQGYGLEELKTRITLVRLTDYKTLHLVGGTSDDIEKDEEVTYAQGCAWQHGPDCPSVACEPPEPPPEEEEEEEAEEAEEEAAEAAEAEEAEVEEEEVVEVKEVEAPEAPEVDLFEGFTYEVASGALPLDLTRCINGSLLHAHMERASAHAVKCGAAMRFRLPPSPRAFVYDELVAKHNQRPKPWSDLSGRSSRYQAKLWRNLPIEVLRSAVTDAKWQPDPALPTIPGNGFDTMEVEAVLETVEVQLFAQPAIEGAALERWGQVVHRSASRWFFKERRRDTSLLLHVLDAMLWEGEPDVSPPIYA